MRLYQDTKRMWSFRGLWHDSAMAFVPEAEVSTVFEPLKELLLMRYVCLSPLLEYFEETYIGNQYRDARFEIALWNQYDRALEGLDRTNNSVEGRHRDISATVGISHPTIWKFVESLKKRIKTQNSEIDQLVAGVLPSPRRRRCENLNERIEVVVVRSLEALVMKNIVWESHLI